jgi:hypothetical protein
VPHEMAPTTDILASLSSDTSDVLHLLRAYLGMANQRKESAVAFLEAAVAYYAKLGIRIERVMWLVLSVNDVQRRLQTPRHSPDLHQAIHAADQRQS